MITTHVLDTGAGRPARGVPVELERRDGDGDGSGDGGGGAWQRIGAGTTDDDGRLRTLTPPGPVAPGTYRIRFVTAAHSPFFPIVEICFAIADGDAHYHVPLLISPFGYSTYRGS